MKRAVLALTLWNFVTHVSTMGFLAWALTASHDTLAQEFIVNGGFCVTMVWAVSTPFTTLLAAGLNHWRAKMPSVTLYNIGAALFWLPSLGVVAASTCLC